MNIQIPILGVTKQVKAYEKRLVNYLKSELKNKGIKLKDISFYDGCRQEEVAQIVKEKFGGKVIILTDAVVGNTNEYESFIKELYKREIKPFVLVTHVESAEVDLQEVAMRPTNLSEYFDERSEWYQYECPYCYLNFVSKKFFTDKEEGLDIFVNSLYKYVNGS